MTFSRQCGLALAALVVFGLAATPAHAQVFQVTAKGTISQIQNPDKLFDSSVAVGVPFTYTETFDLSASDTSGKNTDSGQYTESGDAYGAVVTVGDYTIKPSLGASNYLQVQPFLPGKHRYFAMLSTQPETVSSSHIDTTANAPVITEAICFMSLYFREPCPITSKAMPLLSAYDFLRLSEQSSLVIGFFGPGDPNKYQDQLVCHLTSLTATPPPEPPASALSADPASLPPIAAAAIRKEFEAKDAVIATLRRQVIALQAQIRKMKDGPHNR